MPQKRANPFVLFSVPMLCLQKRVAIGIDAFKTEIWILVTNLALDSLKNLRMMRPHFFCDGDRCLIDGERPSKIVDNISKINVVL